MFLKAFRTCRPGGHGGFILVDVLLALALLTILALGIIQLIDNQQRRARAAAQGEAALRLGRAMQRYVNDQYAVLLNVPAGQSALITVSDLVTAGYLPAGTAARDANGFDLCGLVTQVGAQGAPVRLQGLLVSESVNTRALSLDDLTTALIAGNMGAAGGAIYKTTGSNPGSTIQGIQGGWSVPVSGAFSQPNNRGKRCDGSTAGAVQLRAGHYMMALWDGGQFNNEDVLYRNKIANRPDLNTMNVPLGLDVDASASHDIAFGKPCSQPGLLATDYASNPLNCKNGFWTAGMPDNTPGVTQGQPCPVNGAFSTDKDGTPFICKQGLWNRFDRLGTLGQAKAIGPGLHQIQVPPGVNWAFLTMAGGGESGGFNAPKPYTVKLQRYPTDGGVQIPGTGVRAERYPGSGGADESVDLPWLAEYYPGGSGGYVLSYPIEVTPGSTLCISVGAGGKAAYDIGTGHGFGGGPTTVANCNPSQLPKLITCFGGGAGPGVRSQDIAGAPGSCTVEPSGSSSGQLTYQQGSGHAGGYSPIGYGSGGEAARCWGDCGPEGAVEGKDGADGALFITWMI